MERVIYRSSGYEAYYLDSGRIRQDRATICADYALNGSFTTVTTAHQYKIGVELGGSPKDHQILVDASGCRYLIVGRTVPFPISIGPISVSIVCEVASLIPTVERQWARRPWEITLGAGFINYAYSQLGRDFRDDPQPLVHPTI